MMYLAYQTSKRGKCLSKQIGCCLKVGDLRFVGYFDTEAHLHACPLEVGIFHPSFNRESMCKEVCKCGKNAVEWAVHKLVEYYTDKFFDRIASDSEMIGYLKKDEEYMAADKVCYLFNGEEAYSELLLSFDFNKICICANESDLFDESKWCCWKYENDIWDRV